ncbi:MAG: chitobiase/beta-hexosaminidase C-terminal domain-containing protein, partial [Oscillospiraceae bacterium]|nr:chitobiase/beta-hexosaminidase C-terminal domain-containing protein [Oscillospiraceae bacterium]
MRKVLVSFLVVVLVITSAIILNNDSPTAIDVPDPLLADATAHSSDDDVPYFDENDDDFATDIELLFSHTEHFYESEIFVSIDASLPDTAIFYTLDGAEPSIKSSVYTEPIHIKSQGRNQIEVVTVKAIAAVDDLISRPHVHTYFVGQNVRSRFDTLIFSFSTNEKYLYDHYTGIFVEGITREEYIRTRGNSRNIIPPDP